MKIKTPDTPLKSSLLSQTYSNSAPQKTLLILACKMIVVQLAPLIASLIVARLIAGSGNLEFSAYSLVNSINFTIFIVISGILQSIYVLGGEAIGKQDPKYYGQIMKAGKRLAIIFAVVAIMFSVLIGPALKGLGYDKDFARYSHFFALAACFGIFPSILLIAFRIHASLNQRAGIASTIYLIGSSFTIVICLLFYDRFESAIWLTLFIIIIIGASQWLMLLLAFFSFSYYPELKLTKSEASAINHPEPLKVLYSIGWPIGVVVFLDSFAPLFSSLIVGRLAIEAMPVHSVISLWVVVFAIAPLGLSQSVVQQISVLNGQKNFDARNQTALLAMLLTCAYGVLVYLIFYNWPVEIGELLLGKTDNNTQQLLKMLMPLSGIFSALQGVIIVAAAILRGIGQTKAPMFQAIVGYLIIATGMQILLGYLLKLGISGVWWGMISGYLVTAIIISVRCLRELRSTRNPLCYKQG